MGRDVPFGHQDKYYTMSGNFEQLSQKFSDVGFEASDVRIWYQPCNWYFKDGRDYWDRMKVLICEQNRDEAVREEVIRLFEEERTEMRVFELCFILVTKP